MFAAIASLGAPCLAQAVQVASRLVVTHSSGSIGRPQKVCLIWGLAACITPRPLACFRFISLLFLSKGAASRRPDYVRGCSRRELENFRETSFAGNRSRVAGSPVPCFVLH